MGLDFGTYLDFVFDSGAISHRFYFIEKRQAYPMLDLSLFRKRLFTTSTAAALFNYMALFSILFLMPFYLLQGRGLNPSQAGIILTAQPIVMALIAPLSGTLSDRIGTRLPAVLGMVILAASLFLLSGSARPHPLHWSLCYSV